MRATSTPRAALPSRRVGAGPAHCAPGPACLRRPAARRYVVAGAAGSGSAERGVPPLPAIFSDAREPALSESQPVQFADTVGSVDDDLNRRIASGEFTKTGSSAAGFLKPVRKLLANVPGPGACPPHAPWHQTLFARRRPPPLVHAPLDETPRPHRWSGRFGRRACGGAVACAAFVGIHEGDADRHRRHQGNHWAGAAHSSPAPRP